MKNNYSQDEPLIEQKIQAIEQSLPIDCSIFKPLIIEDLISVLGQTIKKDDANKLITFLALLSAYTYDSQINLSFNAPSSSGKSFIPMEIARLFPQKDVIEIAYVSPTAFFHDVGTFDKEKQGYIVDLSNKILIFLDQPHTLLLQHLRPMLSHDKKEIQLKITDKSQKSGLRTKNIFLIGFPTVIFCSAGLNIDEQEATRFLLLSPEINQEKIRQAIAEKIKRETDSAAYLKALGDNPERSLLKQRIVAIKQEQIIEIRIGTPGLIEQMFFARTKILQPRHQRDIGRIISLTKIIALLNLWYRERDENVLITNEDDAKEAFNIWDLVAESQELNLPPYVYNLYKEVIIPAYNAKNVGIGGEAKLGVTLKEIMAEHFKAYGRHLPKWQSGQQIMPALETAGLITQDKDPNDKRRILIYPTIPLTISHNINNSELDGGVNGSYGLVDEKLVATAEEVFGEKAEDVV